MMLVEGVDAREFENVDCFDFVTPECMLIFEVINVV